MSRTIRAVVDSRIRLRATDLPPGMIADLTDALTIPNLEKDKAKKNGEWDWRAQPDWFSMWEISEDPLARDDPNENILSMPRGFMRDFKDGLTAQGYTLDAKDATTRKRLLRIGRRVEPLPWQAPAMEAIITNREGIYKAPAGSGKTVSVLATIRQLGVKSLIIINTKDILRQWQERVATFLGESYPVGQVGDNVFDVSPYITIATAQTLHARYDQLMYEGFFDQFSFVCLDECHHATADTYNRIMDSFASHWRIGVSATPDKTGDFALASLVLGPVFHETKPSEVTNLIKPKVVRVKTNFFFKYVGARPGRRSNYNQLIDALVADPDRNELIVRRIMKNQGHHQLVLSKRLKHLDLLEQMLRDEGFSDPILRITGDDTMEVRDHARDFANERPSALLSTLADEAMDIPRLDRLHLAYPQSNAGLRTQQVGRVERKHSDKEDSIIYHYADLRVRILDKQWKGQRREVYTPRGYEIVSGEDE